MFGQTWTPAEATIVDRSARFSGSGSSATHTYAADVRLPSGEVFRATIEEPTIATNFWPPDLGDVVSVLVGSKARKVKFDKDDPRLSVKAREAARRAEFEAVQRGEPGPLQPGTLPGGSSEGQALLAAFGRLGDRQEPETVEERLAHLASLQARGLVTPEEYAEQRRRILDEI